VILPAHANKEKTAFQLGGQISNEKLTSPTIQFAKQFNAW